MPASPNCCPALKRDGPDGGGVPDNHVACIGECMVELSGQPDGTLSRSFGGDTLNTALYLAQLGAPAVLNANESRLRGLVWVM